MFPPLPGSSLGLRRHPWARLPLTFLCLATLAWAADDPAAGPPNRLIHESSPYLRQHAHNPVDWYPWGPEAFARAKALNRPIFLSIGYSTCHWCHVMEHESFENPEIARLLNEHFVCIKVDREERPDLDRVYLTFLQASTGGGGWPMSLWLTPQLKPFLARTYLPPEDRAGQVGLKTLIPHLARMWAEQGEQITAQAGEMLAALNPGPPAGGAGRPVAELRQRAFLQLQKNYDAANGGFETAPKFPGPATLELLVDVAATDPAAAVRASARQMLHHTLERMAAGGIHDQLGGGFHRYAVDAQWRIPHFEKMLYDQAQLASVYLSAGLLTADPALWTTARDTLAYVEQRLTDPAGGFYSAEDADSATAGDPATGHEGAFYLWTGAEITRTLGPESAALFKYAHGVQPDGNVTGEAAAEFAGRNILRREHSLAETATQFNRPEAGVQTALLAARQKLAGVAAGRPRPARDDKIVTAWNGLMISAFARGSRLLGEPALAATAARAAEFIHANLFDPQTGRLARSFRAGRRSGDAFAEDYACLIQGLLDLYEADLNHHWLEWAVQLQVQLDAIFWDATGGGYFASAADDPNVVLRLKEDNDGAEPSANSVALRNLARLAALLHRDEWRARAEQLARAFAPLLDRDPAALAQMLAASGWLQDPVQQIVIQGEAGDPAGARLLHEVWSRFLPRKVLLLIDAHSRPWFEQQVPLIAALPANVPGEATAYVCQNFSCQLPTGDPAKLAAQLKHSAATGR